MFKKQISNYQPTPYLYPLGIFVWGDAIILGLFWLLVAVVGFISRNLNLILFIVSTFWLIRSLGEALYWFLQQFSGKVRDKPEDMFCYRFYKDESIWFVYQVFWQCIAVFSLVSSVYFAVQWLVV